MEGQKPVKYSESKFFSVLLGEMIGGADKSATLPTSVTGDKPMDVSWQNASESIDYLKMLLGQIEQRRLFAIMCMSPDKISQMPVSGLSKVVVHLTSVADKLKDDIAYLSRKTKNKVDKQELSHEERAKIDKFIKKSI